MRKVPLARLQQAYSRASLLCLASAFWQLGIVASFRSTAHRGPCLAGQVLGSIWCTSLALWPAVVFLAVCGYTPPTCLQDPWPERQGLLEVATPLALTAGQRCNDNSLVVRTLLST